MDERALEAGGVCFSMALSDETWRQFGFRGRPTGGSVFQRFRAKWKVNLERRLMKEIAIMMYATYVNRRLLSEDLVRQSLQHFFAQPHFAESLGYHDAHDGLLEFQDQIEKYAPLSDSESGVLMLDRIDGRSIPDKKVATQVMFGCSQIRHMCNMVVTGHVSESKRFGISDNQEDGFSDDREFAEALGAMARAMASAREQGSDTDMIPGGTGRFGVEASNPIPVEGIVAGYDYLRRLRWRGQPVTAERIGSFSAANINGPVDGYRIMDSFGNNVCTLYISTYQKKNSCIAPEGFTIVGA